MTVEENGKIFSNINWKIHILILHPLISLHSTEQPLHFSVPWLQIFHIIFKSHGSPDTLEPKSSDCPEFKSLHVFCWVYGHAGLAGPACHNATGLSLRMVSSRCKSHIQKHSFFTMSRVRENRTRPHSFQIKKITPLSWFCSKTEKTQLFKFNKKGEKSDINHICLHPR